MLDFDVRISPTWIRVYDVARRVTASVLKQTSASTADLIDERVRLEVIPQVIRPGQVPFPGKQFVWERYFEYNANVNSEER